MFKPVSPQVDFVENENILLKKWYEKGIVEQYLHKNDSSSEKFSFLDGPITANNPMGVHHAWGRTYKDFWQRYWNAKGKKQRFQNGFDEQGLWVEVEVEKELGLKNKKDIENLVPGDKFASLEKFINLCKERVAKFSAIQTEQSKRLGYFMNWENSYHTSSDRNNYEIWNFLKVVNEKGWLYKGHDTVPWCPRCGTAISQHEILTEEYKELTHDSIFFKLPLDGRDSEFLLVWTTTPWTIPSNVAVAVNPEEEYSSFEVNGEKLWLMDKRISELEKIDILKDGKVNGEKLPGTKLVGWTYSAPFDDLPFVAKTLGTYKHRVIDGGEVVTSEEGTGLLHVAPGAGEEDFKLGKENELPVISAIEEDASYYPEMGIFSGQNAKWHPEIIIDELNEKDGGKFIFTILKYKHRYPTCWRCKTELVWRVVDEWYIAMDTPDQSGKTYREQMVEVAKKINWLPEWGLDRELDWLKNMHSWLISKKRYWGLALPIYECRKCGHFDVIGSRGELQEKAVEGWENFDGNSPHRPWIDEVKIACSECGEVVSRIPDVGNPWLDAGIVPFSTMPEERFPADFITESFPGQFKNWFYSLIAMATALKNENPFKTVLGFASVRDEHGEEMHKSKGNSIEFNEAADKFGVDVMRFMYLKQNPEYNLNFGSHVADEVRRLFMIRLWNVYSFFVTYANLDDFKPDNSLNSDNVLDKWIIARMNQSIKIVSENIESYSADKAVEEIEKFIIDDLSNWYVRSSRTRVNPSSEDAEDRKNALNTLYSVLVKYSILLAPFIPFVSDEIYTNLTGEDSVHLADFPTAVEFDQKLIDQMILGRYFVERVHAVRKEKNLKVRQPLKRMGIFGYTDLNAESFGPIEELLKNELNIKAVEYLHYEDMPKGEFIIDGTQESDYKKKIGLFVDIELTPELLAEGEARDLIRKIQQERKALGTNLDDLVDVDLPSWPEAFEAEIKKRALVRNLTQGEFSVKKV